MNETDSAIKITKDHLKFLPKRIGWLRGDPVFYTQSKGGLNLILAKNGKLIGMANHVAIAKKVAFDNEPEVQFDELSKAEENVNMDHVAFWSEYTQKVIVKLDI